MSRRSGVTVTGVAVALALAGCGTTGESVTARPAALAADAVPYLPSTVKGLTPRALARESGVPRLVDELSGWGFQSGADRYFQGESRQLQVVDSRTLRFRSAVGATAFVTFVRGHTSAYLGSFAQVHSFASRGRPGILAVAQPCQCHLANPAFLGVVRRGGTVSWLLINGPGASPRRLAALFAQAP